MHVELFFKTMLASGGKKKLRKTNHKWEERCMTQEKLDKLLKLAPKSRNNFLGLKTGRAEERLTGVFSLCVLNLWRTP
jgi:hypothetical protein